MRATFARLCVALLCGAGTCLAQQAPIVQNQQPYTGPDHPWKSSVYCSGFYTTEKIPDDLRLVSGEQSEFKITFYYGDTVYLSKGANQGVRDGDRFSVVRPGGDAMPVNWFKWEEKLTKAMGSYYDDLGQIVVVKVEPNISIARVIQTCAYMLRGDILRPFIERPSGPFKDPDLRTFDKMAPISGKPTAMVVRGRDTAQMSGRWDTVYVNLGTAQGVKVGDYFRIFRYQGTYAETIPKAKDFQDRLYGFGSNPKHYAWNDLPREVLGEGIVLNASQNSSSVMITVARNAIFSGDYVELE